MFNKDYPKYIDQQIDECEHALYIINNSDEYYKISDLSEDIQKVEDKIYNIEISMSDILQERTGLSIKSKDIENKITELENKKYTIIELLKGNKKKEKIQLLEFNARMTKIEEKINEIDINIDKNVEYRELLENEINTLNLEKGKIELSLERTFEDFTLDAEFEADELYVNGNYYMKTSLNRLLNKERYYLEKLNELQNIENFGNSKDIVNEKQKIEIDYEKI